MKKAYLLLIFVGLLSCRKEELPVKPFPRGGVQTMRIDLGQNYNNQIWFSFSKEEVVKVNSKFIWDIAFSNTNDLIITLNTSKVMQAAFVENGDLSQNYNNVNNFKPDHPTGKPDSLAFYNWNNKNGIYVVDLGFDNSGQSLGKLNFSVELLSDGDYKINYKMSDETEIRQATIRKNTDYNYQYYSFSTHKVVDVAPPKDQYDVVFTQYTNIFYEPYMPYLVSGVLLNPFLVKAKTYNNDNFSSFNFENIDLQSLTNRNDIVGFDWKTYNIDEALYTTHSDKYFILQDVNLFYFKFRFLDFYDENGIIGRPLMEFAKI